MIPEAGLHRFPGRTVDVETKTLAELFEQHKLKPPQHFIHLPRVAQLSQGPAVGGEQPWMGVVPCHMYEGNSTSVPTAGWTNFSGVAPGT